MENLTLRKIIARLTPSKKRMEYAALPSQTKLDNLMIFAVSKNDHDEFLQAVRNGANPHAHKDAAIYVAAANGNIKTAVYLLDIGLDIHAAEDQALRSAAGKDDREMVALLLQRGANFISLSKEEQEKYRDLLPKTPEEILAAQKTSIRVRQTALRNFVRRR